MTRSAGASVPTRQSLLRRLKEQNDDESWHEFFKIYRPLIRGVAVQSGLTESEAQDVVQETMLTITRKLSGFEIGTERGSFKAWLLRITRRRIVDQFRKRPMRSDACGGSRSDDSSSTATEQRIPDPVSLNLEAVWDEQWKEHLLEQAMQRVKQQASPKEFLLFHQQAVKALPPRLVAEQYAVSLTRVYVARYRIQQMIKKEVRRLRRELG